MKNYFYLLILFVLISLGCEKEVEPKPAALFSFNEEESQTLKMGTNDETALVNNSQNGTAYFWDFGDGRTSTDKDVVLSYPKSGTYEVKLTVSNADGVKSESKKQVVVLDRVIKKIIIEHIQWDTTGYERWPKTTKADVFVQIQQYTDTTMKPMGIFPTCPVLYTSPVIKDVNYRTYTPIEIPVAKRIVIEKRINGDILSNYAMPRNLNQVNLYSLMAVDKSGDVFNLYHNNTGSVRIEKEDIKQNSYILDFTLLSRVRIICAYE